MICNRSLPAKILKIVAANPELTQTQIAQRLGVSRSTVQRALRALKKASNDAPEALRYRDQISAGNHPTEGGEGTQAASPLHLQDRWGDRRWLLWMFEAYVAPTSRYKITDKRRQGWSRGAVILLRDHPLSEVARVMSSMFDDYAGVLPFTITLVPKGKRREVKISSKLTSLRTLAYHYDEASAWVSSLAGAPSGGPPERPF